jgi:hypothetical protein
MSVQGWLVLGIAAVTVAFVVRKFIQNLARKGEGAGCCCDGGGACGKAKRKA